MAHAGASSRSPEPAPGSRRDRRAVQRRARAARAPTQEGEFRIHAGHRVFFHEDGEPLFGPGTYDLLVLVDETGSLHQAAKHMGMAYSKAWRVVRQAEDRFGVKLLNRQSGGAHGGGSVVTVKGQELIRRFRAFLDEADAELARLYRKHFADTVFADSVDAEDQEEDLEGPA